MSVKTFCPRRRHKEQTLLLAVEKSVREEDEAKDIDCLQQFSSCPACNREYDITLILPCSHTMCVHCVAAGGGTRSGQCLSRGASLPVCSVLCPCCQHAVELPCQIWSSATSCLPKHPTLRSACVSQETGTKEGAYGDHFQHVQVRETCCTWSWLITLYIEVYILYVISMYVGL